MTYIDLNGKIINDSMVTNIKNLPAKFKITDDIVIDGKKYEQIDYLQDKGVFDVRTQTATTEQQLYKRGKRIYAIAEDEGLFTISTKSLKDTKHQIVRDVTNIKTGNKVEGLILISEQEKKDYKTINKEEMVGYTLYGPRKTITLKNEILKAVMINDERVKNTKEVGNVYANYKKAKAKIDEATKNAEINQKDYNKLKSISYDNHIDFLM